MAKRHNSYIVEYFGLNDLDTAWCAWRSFPTEDKARQALLKQRQKARLKNAELKGKDREARYGIREENRAYFWRLIHVLINDYDNHVNGEYPIEESHRVY